MSFQHGTYTSYGKFGCRCTTCVEYQNNRNRKNRANRLAEGRLNHGNRSSYDAGCRCDACLDARRAAYEVEKAGAR